MVSFCLADADVLTDATATHGDADDVFAQMLMLLQIPRAVDPVLKVGGRGTNL